MWSVRRWLPGRQAMEAIRQVTGVVEGPELEQF
jgi:hypothetical protein